MPLNYCPDCGEGLIAGKPFCANCGAKVPSAEASVGNAQGKSNSASAKVEPPPLAANDATKKMNPSAIIGLVMGVLCIFLYTLGALPIATIVVSIIGLVKAKNYGGRGLVPAVLGLMLGVLYTLMYMVAYGHI